MAAFEGATRIPSTVAYAILLVLLLGLYRCTSIGLDRVPDALACRREACGDARPLALRPAPGSPRHLLVPVALHGRALLFLLDTGAASTVVAAGEASLLGADFFGGMRLHVDVPASRLTLRTRTLAVGGPRPGVGARPHAG